MQKIESEKLLEKKLRTMLENLGGWALKIPAIHVAGIPDRLCLLPHGKVFFAEIKTTKKKPTKIQLVVHKKLRKMGFAVEIIDTTEGLIKVIEHHVERD